jgi:hypothetical protein
MDLGDPMLHETFLVGQKHVSIPMETICRMPHSSILLSCFQEISSSQLPRQEKQSWGLIGNPY